MPNWFTLENVNAGRPLRDALRNWASGENLTSEWCLDHALTFFREFEAADDKPLALALWQNHNDGHFLGDLLRRSWTWAAHKSCNALAAQFQTSSEFEVCGPYSFEFSFINLRFTVSGPFFKSKADFEREVAEAFRTCGGPAIRGAKKALTHQKRIFLEEVASHAKELGLEEPSPRWRTHEHLRWLVDYQLPPSKPYRLIAGNNRKDESTVRKGVKRAAALLGLTLRSCEADMRAGRPKGAKDKYPRHRAANGG